MLGKHATVQIDLPMGSHCAACGCFAPVNYGHITSPASIAGQEAYALELSEPMQYAEGRIVGKVIRPGSALPVWVVAPRVMFAWEIRDSIAYQENVYGSELLPLADKSCGGILFRREEEDLRVLLIRSRKHGYWGFPKGHTESGESEEATAAREILEETGLTVSFVPGFRGCIPISLPEGGAKDLVFLLAECAEKNVVLSEEHSESIWLTPKEAEAYITFENDREIFRSAMDFLGQKMA